jgi:uncharacterized repeat protein (TIGR01451 family)
VSADGTRVAFLSTASNLDPADPDAVVDVFVKDLVSGDLTLVSTSDSGVKGSGFSPSVSADGTRVAFLSTASNLDPADPDAVVDVFVKDLVSGDLTLVSTSDSGVKGNELSFSPSVSADGTRVAFQSNASNLDPADTDTDIDVYVKDLVSGDLTLVSTSDSGVKGNNASTDPSVSGDGTRVAFRSFADNLDPADTDSLDDVYVKDLVSGDLTLVSTSDSGVKGDFLSLAPSVSDDGTRVAFQSFASNLDPADTDGGADVYVKDLLSGDLTLMSTSDSGVKGGGFIPSVSGDGTGVAFLSGNSNLDPADTDTLVDVYLKELGPASAPSADLSVAKSDSADPVRRGQQFTYTIRVTNTGPDEGTGVVVTDTLPTGVRLVSAQSPSGTCSQARRVVTCDLQNIPTGQQATITIIVTAHKQGIKANTASVTANESDPTANNTDTETTTVR